MLILFQIYSEVQNIQPDMQFEQDLFWSIKI